MKNGGPIMSLSDNKVKTLTTTAIIAVYNEADIIKHSVSDLISQGIFVYLIDTGSTDGTTNKISHFLGQGLIKIEEMPLDNYAHGLIMKRKEVLANELHSDWFISADADEFRESPWLSINLLEGIRLVDAMGYNAIDFAVLDFVPTHDAINPGDDPRDCYVWYEPGGVFNKLQVRCWKKTEHQVELASSGGHEAIFPERKIFPIRFILRHYPFRGQAHGERKLFKERRPRYPEDEKKKGWHIQYDNIQKGHCFIKGTEGLKYYDPEQIRIELQVDNRALEMQKIDFETQITNRNVQIDKLQNIIKSKDIEIARLESVVKNQNAKIENLKIDASNKDSNLLTLRQAISERDERIARIMSSYSWRITLPFRIFLDMHNKVIEMVMPQTTQRRYYYDLWISVCRTLLNEGVKSFITKSRHRLGYSKTQLQQNNPVVSHLMSLSVKPESEIIFPYISKPEVSIVIPVYNHWEYTIRCLSAIHENTSGSYEVIVVDDASTDETTVKLDNIRNLRVEKKDKNEGFIEACNLGAVACRGKYILFLNNDVLVQAGWLEPLLDIIKKNNVGAVGAKLVYPNGTLQEAGCIIWNDGSGWNYGRGDHPDNPQYNFIREVDYCSGACLLVKKRLFSEVGGFDTRFRPAYYEDTDLCFALRDMGYQVIYQPKSVAVHYEGITSGTELSDTTKKYQQINKSKFYDKWAKTLEKEYYPADKQNVNLARNRMHKKRILIIDHYVPQYDKDSGSMRMYAILKILTELGYGITFIGDNLFKAEPYTEALQQIGVEVMYAPFISSVKDFIKSTVHYFHTIILSRSHIAIKYINFIKRQCPRTAIIYDTVDLSFVREMRRAYIQKNKDIFLVAENCRRTELYLAKNSDVTFVVSSEEKKILLKEDSSLRVEVVSNVHNITMPETPFSKRKDILFVGGFEHPPNTDAVLFLVNEIMPLVKRRLFGICLYIIGHNPPEDVVRLNSKDVIVTGYIQDITPYFERCRVFVAPLRFGAGVKGKINQSMSHGLPVVTTSIGAEGIGLINNLDALIADEPTDFAEKVVSVYLDEDLWNKLSINSIENVRRHFSPDVARQKIKSVMDELTFNDSHVEK